MLTCYSPVRRSSTPKGLSARLACVKHAASVRPEPGSNSPTKIFGKSIPTIQKEIAEEKPAIKQTMTGHNLALAYPNTLLSSQETNTHRNPTPAEEAAFPGQLHHFTRSSSRCQPRSRRIFVASLGTPPDDAHLSRCEAFLGESPQPRPIQPP